MQWIYGFEITWVLNFQKLWPFWTTIKTKYKVHCLVFYFAIVFVMHVFHARSPLAFKFLNLFWPWSYHWSWPFQPPQQLRCDCSSSEQWTYLFKGWNITGLSEELGKRKYDFQELGPNMIVFHMHANSSFSIRHPLFISEKIIMGFLFLLTFSLVSLIYFWRPTI